MTESDVEHLRPRVEAVLREYLQLPEGEPLLKDDDGDVPIRWESALYYVRVLERDPVLVRVFAFILREVDKTPALLETLNEINRDIVSARIFWHDGAVLAAAEVPAATLDLEDLSHTCWAVGTLALWAEGELQPVFGGRPSSAEAQGAPGADPAADA